MVGHLFPDKSQTRREGRLCREWIRSVGRYSMDRLSGITTLLRNAISSTVGNKACVDTYACGFVLTLITRYSAGVPYPGFPVSSVKRSESFLSAARERKPSSPTLVLHCNFTLGNSNFRKQFFSLQVIFYIILPSITQIMSVNTRQVKTNSAL